jgi:hypothetical protein
VAALLIALAVVAGYGVRAEAPYAQLCISPDGAAPTLHLATVPLRESCDETYLQGIQARLRRSDVAVAVVEQPPWPGMQRGAYRRAPLRVSRLADAPLEGTALPQAVALREVAGRFFVVLAQFAPGGADLARANALLARVRVSRLPAGYRAARERAAQRLDLRTAPLRGYRTALAVPGLGAFLYRCAGARWSSAFVADPHGAELVRVSVGPRHAARVVRSRTTLATPFTAQPVIFWRVRARRTHSAISLERAPGCTLPHLVVQLGRH